MLDLMGNSKVVDPSHAADTDSEGSDDVLAENSFRTLNPSLESTGLRTHALRYDCLRCGSGGRIAEDFLINSRLLRGDPEMGVSVASYFSEPTATMLTQLGRDGRRGCFGVALPKSVDLNMGLDEVIQRRRSVRKYSGEPMPLAYLATIVRAACGITSREAYEHGAPGHVLRSVPSGGALYPVDLYLAAVHVESLSRGLYLYDPQRDELWQTGDEGTVTTLLESIALPDQVITETHASAVCLLVGRPWRSMRKHGARGMRYVFLEAGAMAEHINLAAVALGFGSVDCGSFYDDEVHDAVEIDGLYEALIHSVFLGKPR